MFDAPSVLLEPAPTAALAGVARGAVRYLQRRNLVLAATRVLNLIYAIDNACGNLLVVIVTFRHGW